ncbi:efflux RND transporter periplasmic adaptor subunit [Thioalkalivibrio sp.]|uniref:efflux RND transporter periplasmic adaptor subunit n=1 Tax=Thioalkalivibrio sp. TaxID=2093813 RepID=UPI0035646BC5
MSPAKMLRKLLPLLIIVAAGVGFLVLRATGPTAPPPEESERVWQVRGIVAQPATHRPTLDLFGRSSSPQTAVLRAAVEGEIGSVPAQVGRAVADAGLLVRIDPSETRLILEQREAEVREAEAAVESERLRAETDQRLLQREQALLQIARRGLERARELRTGNLGSEADVDDAQRNLEQARVAVDNRQQAVADASSRLARVEARARRAGAAAERARMDLARTEIRAPSAARVVEVHVSPGERARVGDALVRLYALNDLEVRASLPEAIVPRINDLLDEGVHLQAEAMVGGRHVRASLDRLAGETRAGEAGISAIFRVVEGGRELPLNRFVNLRLSLPEETRSVVVPFESLYGRDRVYRVVDGRMQGLTVERLGQVTDLEGRTRALIQHPDLEEGDVLVATRLPNAVDGLRVEVELNGPDERG